MLFLQLFSRIALFTLYLDFFIIYSLAFLTTPKIALE
jgi:hypothetical protein